MTILTIKFLSINCHFIVLNLSISLSTKTTKCSLLTVFHLLSADWFDNYHCYLLNGSNKAIWVKVYQELIFLCFTSAITKLKKIKKIFL